MPRYLQLAGLMGALCLHACGSDGLDVPDNANGYRDPVGPGVSPTPGPTSGGETPEPVDIPPAEIDFVNSPVPFDTVPIRGRATPRMQVIVRQRDVASGTSAQINTGGRFCVDFPLEKDARNNIVVEVLDGRGNISPPVEFMVEHRSEEDDPNQPPEDDGSVRNVLLEDGVVVTPDDDPEMGVIEELFDGDPGTEVLLSSSFCPGFDCPVTVKFELPKLYTVNRLRVVFTACPEGCEFTEGFAKEFKIYGARQSDDPGEPEDDNPLWHTLTSVTNGQGGSQTLDVAPPSDVRWLALYLIKDGDFDFAWNEYWIGEFEAIGVPTDFVPSIPEAPTCESGG